MTFIRPDGSARSFEDMAAQLEQTRAEAEPDWELNPTGQGLTVTTGVPPRTSRFLRVSELEGLPVPPREELVPGLIPMKTVTIITGDGATGKSLISKQLAAAIASNGRWLGRVVMAGGVLYITAEDDLPELHRRLIDIVAAEGIDLADLDRFTIRSLAGEDALLAHDTPKGLIPTPLYAEVDAQAGTIPDLRAIFLDTSADLFPANENDRAKVRQFIGLLRGLAIRHDCAVILLSHPSLSGLASGSGTSGSTAWNNSVRSRLYLERIKDGDGDRELDPDRRRLTVMKANYGQIGEEILMRWERGAFRAENQAHPSGLDRMAAGEKAERVFLKLLDAFTAQGRYVSPSGSSTFAPAVFAKHPDAERVTKRALSSAMETLISRGTITVATHGRASKERQHLARATGGDHV